MDEVIQRPITRPAPLDELTEIPLVAPRTFASGVLLAASHGTLAFSSVGAEGVGGGLAAGLAVGRGLVLAVDAREFDDLVVIGVASRPTVAGGGGRRAKET